MLPHRDTVGEDKYDYVWKVLIHSRKLMYADMFLTNIITAQLSVIWQIFHDSNGQLLYISNYYPLSDIFTFSTQTPGKYNEKWLYNKVK